MDERRGRKPLGEEKRTKRITINFTEEEYNRILSALPDEFGPINAQIREILLRNARNLMQQKNRFS